MIRIRSQQELIDYVLNDDQVAEAIEALVVAHNTASSTEAEQTNLLRVIRDVTIAAKEEEIESEDCA